MITKEMLEELTEEELEIVREHIVSKFDNIISEMAFNRKDVIRKIEDLEDQINLHLIKIIRYKDEVNFEKHIKDIMTWLIKIQRMDVGKKDKKLPEKDYFKILFLQPFTDIKNTKRIKNYERAELKSYTKLPILRTEEETIEIIFIIQKEIAKRLSEDDIYEIDEFIKNILKGNKNENN